MTGHVARCVRHTPGVKTLTAHSRVSATRDFSWTSQPPPVKASIHSASLIYKMPQKERYDALMQSTLCQLYWQEARFCVNADLSC